MSAKCVQLVETTTKSVYKWGGGGGGGVGGWDEGTRQFYASIKRFIIYEDLPHQWF